MRNCCLKNIEVKIKSGRPQMLTFHTCTWQAHLDTHVHTNIPHVYKHKRLLYLLYYVHQEALDYHHIPWKTCTTNTKVRKRYIDRKQFSIFRVKRFRSYRYSTLVIFSMYVGTKLCWKGCNYFRNFSIYSVYMDLLSSLDDKE